MNSEGVHAVSQFVLVDGRCDLAVGIDRTGSSARVSGVTHADSDQGGAGKSGQVLDAGKKKAAQATTTPKKEEAQKLNPIVVTATRIPQPIGEIGTTITVVEDQQIEEQKIQLVSDVLRQVPGVQVTQSGSPGSETDVSIQRRDRSADAGAG